MQDHAIGLGHNNPPTAAVAPSWLAGRRAIIRRRKRPVETAGRARENEWVLTFERCTPPEIEPLMGWTGGDDTLATEVRLAFATRAQAVAYAERQGLAYDAEPEPAQVSLGKPVSRPGMMEGISGQICRIWSVRSSTLRPCSPDRRRSWITRG